MIAIQKFMYNAIVYDGELDLTGYHLVNCFFKNCKLTVNKCEVGTQLTKTHIHGDCELLGNGWLDSMIVTDINS